MSSGYSRVSYPLMDRRSIGPVLASGRARQIAIEQTRLVYQQLPAGLGGTLITAAMLTFAFWGKVDLWKSIVWAILMILILCGRAWLLLSYNRAATKEFEYVWWRQFFVAGAVFGGCGWAIGATLFFTPESFLHQTFLTFIMEGLAIAAIPSLAAVKLAIVGFILPTTMPLAILFLLEGGRLPLTMGVMSAMFGGFACVVALRYHATITESLALRFDTRDLQESNEALQHSYDILEQRVQERTRTLQQEVIDRTRSEAHARAMLQAIPDAVFRIDRDGLFLEYKAEHRSSLQVPESFFLGRRMIDVLPQDVAQKGLAVIAETLRTGDAHVFEYRLSVDGKTREYESRLAVCGTDEVVALVRDITQQKEVERLKEELVSTVSHELRTPLTSVRGFTELMLSRTFPPEKQREFLLILQREAVRLTDLINDFLDLRRMESGQEKYDITPAPLEPLLQQSLALFLSEGGAHTFRLEVPAPLPLVEMDVSRIRQVLVNLLSNAVKFSPVGGEIVLGAQVNEHTIVVWVKDQGVGMAEDILQKVFDRFFRADNRSTRSVGGTGLGLALVKEIITAHKSRIWAESTPGAGSTFYFTLPLAQSAGSPAV